VKISDVFRKRALLGVAIFCITAIATVGALSIGGNGEDDTPDSLVDLNETDEPEDGRVAEGQQDDPEVKDPSQVAENPDVQNPEVKDPSQVAEQPDDVKEPEQTEVLSPQLIAEQLNFDKSAGLLWPISGEVIIPYSSEHGVFHFTLEQFSASEAIVLSSAVGTEVKAAAKGVVTAIEEDVRTGTTVTLALGNDTSLVYGQMDVADLKVGDVVEAGECIGTVAEPTRYYVVEGPNLYFRVMEGDNSIDPTQLLEQE